MLELPLSHVFELHEKLIEVSVGVVLGLGIIILFWLLSFASKFLVTRVAKHFGEEKKPIFEMLGSIAKTAVLLLGIVTGLGSMGIDVSALVAGLGLTGFALSFAMKD